MSTQLATPLANFNPYQYSDVPLYNIQAVAAATGVPAITLRSWERRYGVPEPKRDVKGYRLYSERDIAVTRWLRERVQQGVGISRAVNMLRVLSAGELDTMQPATFDLNSLHARVLDGIQRLDESAVNRALGEALMVAPVEDVVVNLIQPVLYDVGEMWADGRLTVTSEHMGSNLIRSHLAQLIRLSPPPHRRERIMIGAAPGEFHDIGALTLALFLRRRGFEVIYLGASVEAESLVADAHRIQPEAVLLSASSLSAVLNIKEIYDRLHDYHGLLGFGGRAFNEQPEVAERVPGVLLGYDAAAALENLEMALQRQAV